MADVFTTILFDMDGVLLESELWMLACSRNLLEQYGRKVSDAELLKLTGTPEEYYDAHMAAFLGLPLEKYRRISAPYFKAHPMPYAELTVPGASELLLWLSQHGYQLGLVTSDTAFRTDRKLEQTGWTSFFDVVVTDDMVQNSKPDPEGYLRAARLLGAEASECLVVEDSRLGVSAARAAGVTVAARENDLVPQDISKADIQIETLKEIKEILLAGRKE